MLRVENLVVNYGSIEAVKGITFDVPKNSIVALVGSNGAGKSTTLVSIMGLVKPRSGSIFLDGAEITGLETDVIVKKNISLTPEGRKIFPNLTVLENIRIGAYLRKDDYKVDLEWVYSLFPRLKERSWQLGGTLSGGEQQMLCVARALMSKPKVLMMDEPSLGLAPMIVEEIFNIINTIRDANVTILLVEQNANMALHIADKGYVMETGSIILSGTGKELLENQLVQDAYLGD